jgi:hypothetical protein
MNLIRNCLMYMGLTCLLFITSCVVGVSSCSRAVNPTSFTRTIAADPGKTRRMLRDFFERAALESPDQRGLGEKRSTLAVQDYSDGSIHLTLDGDKGRLMEVVTSITPVDGDQARVEVASNAKELAQAAPDSVSPASLHREIKAEVEAALAAIEGKTVLPRGFRVSRLLSRARKGGF